MPIINTVLTLEDLPPPPPGKTGWPWTQPSQPLPQQIPDGSEWPRISIVIPSYNYGQFIEEAIRSVLLQGYPNLECIVIDGGSTDETVEIINKYKNYLAYWVSEPDKGQTDAINKGYQHCTGDIFAWLNADDSYANSTCLQNMSKFYLQGYNFICGACLNLYSEDCQEVIPSISTSFSQYLKIWTHRGLPQPSVFVSKEIADACFPLDNNLFILMDYQFFLRVLSQNPKSVVVDQVWTHIKYHGGNKTLSNYSEQLSEFRNVALLESRKLPGIWAKIFEIEMKDYLLLHSLVMAEEFSTTSPQLLAALASKPTIGRWPLFWKALAKAFVGTHRYSTLRKFFTPLRKLY